MVAHSCPDPRVIDDRILSLARRGDVAGACEMLVDAYGAEIVGTCTARMGSPAAGQDAAQDTMARALVALAEYRGSAGLRPWLHRIAANRCIDLIRSRRSRQSRTVDGYELEMLQSPRAVMPHEEYEASRARQRQLKEVRNALTTIKEPDRTWVELHYTHGVPYEDIAADAGLSRAAVKQRIWRAVKRVRAFLCAADGGTHGR